MKTINKRMIFVEPNFVLSSNHELHMAVSVVDIGLHGEHDVNHYSYSSIYLIEAGENLISLLIHQASVVEYHINVNGLGLGLFDSLIEQLQKTGIKPTFSRSNGLVIVSDKTTILSESEEVKNEENKGKNEFQVTINFNGDIHVSSNSSENDFLSFSKKLSENLQKSLTDITKLV